MLQALPRAPWPPQALDQRPRASLGPGASTEGHTAPPPHLHRLLDRNRTEVLSGSSCISKTNRERWFCAQEAAGKREVPQHKGDPERNVRLQGIFVLRITSVTTRTEACAGNPSRPEAARRRHDTASAPPRQALPLPHWVSPSP